MRVVGVVYDLCSRHIYLDETKRGSVWDHQIRRRKPTLCPGPRMCLVKTRGCGFTWVHERTILRKLANGMHAVDRDAATKCDLPPGQVLSYMCKGCDSCEAIFALKHGMFCLFEDIHLALLVRVNIRCRKWCRHEIIA
jgi:hypothetical protein